MSHNESTRQHSVSYVGPARGVSFFDALLREEGATEVDYTPPIETRDLVAVASEVSVNVLVSATTATLIAAASKLATHFPGCRVLGLPEPAPKSVGDRLAEVEQLFRNGRIDQAERDTTRLNILSDL